MDLKEEDILGPGIHDHWYYVAKGRAMRHLLGDTRVSEVVDVGAGSGVFSRQLLDSGFCESAVCVDPNYPEEKDELHNGMSIRFVKSCTPMPHDLTLFMDVLEHVEDDVSLLKEYTDNMNPGGQVLITVPAFQFMWSGHDVFLEHHRRYTLGAIEAVAKNAGLTPVRSRYFFGSLFPGLAAVRLVKRILLQRGALVAKSELQVYPKWLNTALIRIHDVERRILFPFNKLFGLSAFCLCRK
jgi:SAM-dependent methyltransferase